VLGNDTDPDVPTQTLTAVRNADVTSGTLTLNSDGSFTYNPPNNFLGSTTFTYHAFDGTASSNIATVTITVTIDDPPLAASDAYTITEDTQLSVPAANGVLDNDSDPDSASITATLLTGPTHGTLSLAADGSFVYTPSLNYNGTDSFYYRAFDGYNYSSQEVVNLTITPVNDAPNAVDDSYTLNLSTETNGTLDIGNSALGLLANDSDVDAGTTLTASFATQAQHGSVQIYPDGSFVYTPNQGFYGADSFTYQVSDGSLTDTAQVDLVVDLQAPDVTWLQPLNDPDPANNENVLYLGAPGGYLPFEVLATDNRGIDHIEFYDYDPNLNIWFLLATSNGEPVNIKLDQLLNHWNQIVVSVYDTSGNLTNSIYLKIWQPARYRQFLAVMHK
jgi:VCBS repeat-containing protein